jgi:PPOX class probable F420-dependent enzyme
VAIGSEKYVALTTYRKDGTPRPLPVWIAELDDGQVGLITPSDSWKVKRLANDDRVRVQPSDGRGNVREGTEPIDGTAVVLDGDGFERVRERVAAKYGFQYRLWGWGQKVAALRGRPAKPDRAIVITLDSSSAPT